MEKGARLPMKLSEYLESVKAKRAAQAPGRTGHSYCEPRSWLDSARS